MGSLAASQENLEGAEEDVIEFTGPQNWVFDESLLQSIIASYDLGIKELRMFMTFVIIWTERRNGIPTGGIRLVNLKALLGRGFGHDSEFRTVRKRLERVNLLKVQRESSPGRRGGSRSTYELLLLPNRTIRAGQSVFKDLDLKDYPKGNKTIKGNAKDEKKSYIGGQSITKTIMDGVEDWEPKVINRQQPVRGDTSAPVPTWGGAHRLTYFLEQYNRLHNSQYVISAKGVYERRVMDLPTSNEVYKDFIDWLFKEKDLKSINFLPEQFNNYLRKNIVSPDKRVEQAVKGEFFKTGDIVVVHQYGGFAVVGKQVLALDAIERGLITVQQVIEWDLCPHNVLNRMGLLV